jgi:hypothetical protein
MPWSWADLVKVDTDLSTCPASASGGQVDRFGPTFTPDKAPVPIGECASKRAASGPPPSATAVVAPCAWFERDVWKHATEPSYAEPCLERRGRIEQQGQVRLHFCIECGAWGAFGYDVDLCAGRPGRWYCRDHRPSPEKL